MDYVKKQRHRSMNFTREERRLLLTIMKRYEHILNNRDNHRITLQRKNLAWDEIQKFFNASPTCNTYRTTESLRKLFVNMKVQARKPPSEPNTSNEADGDNILSLIDCGEPDGEDVSSDSEDVKLESDADEVTIEDYTIMFKKSPSPQPEPIIADPQRTTFNQPSSQSNGNIIKLLTGDMDPLQILGPSSNSRTKTLDSSTHRASNLNNDCTLESVSPKLPSSSYSLAEEKIKLEIAKFNLESLKADAKYKTEIHELQVKQMMIEEQIKTQQLENLRVDAELKQAQLENLKLACEIKIKQLEDPDEQ